MALWMVFMIAVVSPAVEIYVAPAGSDSAPGTLEAPFATMHRAQEAVRELTAQCRDGEISVWFRGGRYELSEPVVFGPEDSGTKEHPVVYRAFPGEEPVFSGAVPLRGWQKVIDPPEGVSEAAVGRLWMATAERGRSFSRLYIDGTAYNRSVWPDTDVWENWPVARRRGEELILPASFHFRLPNPKDVKINYLPTPYTKWINLFNTVTEAQNGVIQLEKPILKIGILEPTEEIPFRIENALEGIDRPGEWSLNTETGTVYLWPPDDAVGGMLNREAFAAQMDTLFILRGDRGAGKPIEYLTFEGLSFEAAKTGMSIQTARNSIIRACRFEQMDDTGLAASDLQDSVVEHCLVSHCGRHGISFGSVVDGKDLELSALNLRNRIEHNEVHRIGQVHWQSSAITLTQAGHNLICHNYVHHLPYAGIFVGGRRFYVLKADLEKTGRKTQEGIPEQDMTIYGIKRHVPGYNRIENNVVHDVMMNLDDGGAIYCHASNHNVLKNNIVYRMHGANSLGLYFDDDEMYSRMENNLIFARKNDPAHRSSILLHDNSCNYVFRNIISFSRKPIFTPSSYGGHMIAQNIFLIRENGEDQGDLSRNSGRYKDLKWDAGQPIMDNNIYWSLDDGRTAEDYVTTRHKKGFDLHSRIEDPGFTNAAEGQFGFSTASPVWQMGIRPIDTSGVGIKSRHEAVKGKASELPDFFED